MRKIDELNIFKGKYIKFVDIFYESKAINYYLFLIIIYFNSHILNLIILKKK